MVHGMMHGMVHGVVHCMVHGMVHGVVHDMMHCPEHSMVHSMVHDVACSDPLVSAHLQLLRLRQTHRCDALRNALRNALCNALCNALRNALRSTLCNAVSAHLQLLRLRQTRRSTAGAAVRRAVAALLPARHVQRHDAQAFDVLTHRIDAVQRSESRWSATVEGAGGVSATVCRLLGSLAGQVRIRWCS